MIKIKKPIILKLLLRIALPLFIIYVLILTYTYQQNKTNAINKTKEYLSELVKHNAQKLDKEFAELAHASRTIKNFIETNYPVPLEKIFSFIEREVESDPNNIGSGFAFQPYRYDKNREKIAYFIHKKDHKYIASDLTQLYDYLNEDWFVIPQKLNKAYWTEPFWGRVTEDILVINTNPISIDGEIIGVCYADLSLDMLTELTTKTTISNAYTFIVSNMGTFIYHPNQDWVMKETVFSLAEQYQKPEMRKLGQEMINFHAINPDDSASESVIGTFLDFETNEKKWIVYTSIPSTGWTFAAVINEKDVLQEVNKLAYTQFFIMLIGLIVLLTIIVLVSKSFSGRLKKLAEFTDEIASGNLEICKSQFDLVDSGEDEIAELGKIFFKMMNDLKRYISDLTQITKDKESVESEIRIARQIQESLLPHIFPPFPHRKEFDLYAVNIAAKEVAGDFYDFFFINDYTIALVMADVSGKGVSAGLFMAITKTLIKTMCTADSSPETALRYVNDILCKDNDSCMFTTLFLAYFDVRDNRFYYSNAGHVYPLLISSDGECKEIITEQDVALGIFEDHDYRLGEIHLEINDIIVLYTDGVPEAINQKEEMYGEQRFKDLIINNKDKELKEIISVVTDDLQEFQGTEQFDDITILTFKRVL